MFKSVSFIVLAVAMSGAGCGAPSSQHATPATSTSGTIDAVAAGVSLPPDPSLQTRAKYRVVHVESAATLAAPAIELSTPIVERHGAHVRILLAPVPMPIGVGPCTMTVVSADLAPDEAGNWTVSVKGGRSVEQADISSPCYADANSGAPVVVELDSPPDLPSHAKVAIRVTGSASMESRSVDLDEVTNELGDDNIERGS